MGAAPRQGLFGCRHAHAPPRDANGTSTNPKKDFTESFFGENVYFHTRVCFNAYRFARKMRNVPYFVLMEFS